MMKKHSDFNILTLRNFFMKKTVIASLVSLFLCLILFSCYTPNPLYGTWADNNGNTYTFQQDYSFTSKVSMNNKIYSYTGTWQVLDNVISFAVQSVSVDGSEETSVSKTIITEWDLRGSILYLSWTEENISHLMTLYHTKK